MSTLPSLPVAASLQPFLAVQAQLAQAAKAALDASQQLRTQQSATGLGLLHAQLDLFNSGLGSASGRQLLQLQSQFFDGLASGQKEVLRQFTERAQAYGADLRQTNSGEEVSLVTVGFFQDLGKVLQESAEQTLSLINSTSAASSVLTRQTLDETIDAAART